MIHQPSARTRRLIHITDSHLYHDPEAELLKMNTQQSFEQVLQLVAEEQDTMDAILATGDIAQDGSLAAYQRFGRAMQRFGVPFYWIPGNHDSPSMMIKAAEEACEEASARETAGEKASEKAREKTGQKTAQKTGEKTDQNANQKARKEGCVFTEASRPCIDMAPWQIIMLDSSVRESVHGFLDQQQLELLESCLTAAVEDERLHHSLVCLHHNPMPGSADWMEGIGLHNSNELLAVLRKYPTVRGVLHGHIHQALDFEQEGIRFICTPSTCIQFKPNATDFALDECGPAYRWLELDDDGMITTQVRRLSNYDYVVDYESSGY